MRLSVVVIPALGIGCAFFSHAMNKALASLVYKHQGIPLLMHNS